MWLKENSNVLFLKSSKTAYDGFWKQSIQIRIQTIYRGWIPKSMCQKNKEYNDQNGSTFSHTMKLGMTEILFALKFLGNVSDRNLVNFRLMFFPETWPCRIIEVMGHSRQHKSYQMKAYVEYFYISASWLFSGVFISHRSHFPRVANDFANHDQSTSAFTLW